MSQPKCTVSTIANGLLTKCSVGFHFFAEYVVFVTIPVGATNVVITNTVSITHIGKYLIICLIDYKKFTCHRTPPPKKKYNLDRQ